MFGLLTVLPNAGRVPFEPTMRVTSDDYDNGKPHDILELPRETRRRLASELIPSSGWVGYFREPFIKAVDDPIEFRHRLLGNASKTMFVMLPLFALVTLMAFRRSQRVYLEQLTLALHIHTLAFLLFAVAAVIGSEGHASFRFAADLLLALGIPGYALMTFKKVFGFSWPSTLLRSAAVAVAYLTIFIFTEAALLVATVSSF